MDRCRPANGSGERVRRPGTVVALGRGDGSLVSIGFAGPAASWTPGYDEPVIALRRRAANPRFPILAVALAVLAIGCGSSAAATSSASSRTAVAPSLTAVPGGPASPVVRATVGPPTTTDTDFGTIFDSLPASFPTLPGQEPADTGAGPTSGSFALNVTPQQAMLAMRAALAGADWTVDVGSPLEDGTVVLEATHAPAGCKTEVRFTPLSGTVIMSVLYGASCPFA